MRSSFTGIEMAKRALFTQQAALTTTGHNIANANTRGYTRQVVNMVAAKPIEAVGLMRSTVPGQMGQSVEFDHINRIREGFLDSQYYNENKSYGEWSVRQDTMDKLEAIVNEPSDSGLSQVMANFWNSWQELSKDPDNLTARAVVKERSLGLADAFNHVSKKLSDLSSDLTDSINVKLGQANTYLGQIANLNNEIFRVEGLGNDANDLRDQRDVIVDDLSKLVNVTVSNTSQGYTVKMGGVTLVDGIKVTTNLSAQNVSTFVNSKDLSSGEIYGSVVSRDQFVANYQLQLDSLAKTMATNVNDIHKTGYMLDGSLDKAPDFFTMQSGATDITAASITVNPDIVSNVSKISTSDRTYIDSTGNTKVVSGNNDIALQIAELRNVRVNFDPNNTQKTVMSGGTFDEFMRAVVGQLGVQSQEATRQSDNQKALVDQVDSRRQSVSGVSLDEEMANMIKFQQAYNAAARSLTTVDEMLDKLINSTGTVGR